MLSRMDVVEIGCEQPKLPTVRHSRELRFSTATRLVIRESQLCCRQQMLLLFESTNESHEKDYFKGRLVVGARPSWR